MRLNRARPSCAVGASSSFWPSAPAGMQACGRPNVVSGVAFALALTALHASDRVKPTSDGLSAVPKFRLEGRRLDPERTTSGARAVGHRLVADGVAWNNCVAVGGQAADARLAQQAQQELIISPGAMGREW